MAEEKDPELTPSQKYTKAITTHISTHSKNHWKAGRAHLPQLES